MPIVVFDSKRLDVFQEFLPNNGFSVLDVRRESTYVNWNTILRSVYYLARFGRKGRPYLRAVLRQMKPKLVLTFFDNDPRFHVLASAFPNTRFVAFQNGWRFPGPGAFQFPLNAEYDSEMICFGHNEIDSFKSIGVSFKAVVPAGSLRDAIYRDGVTVESGGAQHTRYDLCLISSFREGLSVHPDWPFFVALNLSLASYVAKSKGLRFIIAAVYDSVTRPPESDAESRFYKGIYGCDVQVVRYPHDPMSTYQIVDASAVNFSICSTASVEALGRGRRTLVASPMRSYDLDLDTERLWYINAVNHDLLARRLDQLLSMTDAQFVRWTSEDRRYFAGQPTDADPRRLLEQMIHDSMEISPSDFPKAGS